MPSSGCMSLSELRFEKPYALRGFRVRSLGIGNPRTTQSALRNGRVADRVCQIPYRNAQMRGMAPGKPMRTISKSYGLTGLTGLGSTRCLV